MASFSILIPVHNCEKHIAKAIESAMAENPSEIIVFDDASTDRTREIIRRYPVGYHSTKTRAGAQVARNQLVYLSCAEYLQFLDADDFLLSGKIQSQIGKAAISYTNFQVEKYQNRIYQETYPINTGRRSLLHSLMVYEWMPITGSFLFHRSVFDNVKWDESPEYAYGMQDRKMTLDLLKAGYNPLYVENWGYVHRCGWSGTQISSGENYMKARQQFTEDLFGWLAEIEAQTRRRLQFEIGMQNC